MRNLIPAARFATVARWPQIACFLLFALTTGTLPAQSSVRGWGQTVFNSAWSEAQDYVEIAAGSSHTVARRSDGSVVAWGTNGSGKTIVPALPPGLTYVEIAAGGGHTVARRSDGSVVAWGDNIDGKLNVPALPTGLTYVEIAAGTDHTVVRRSDGSVFALGNNYFGSDRAALPALAARLLDESRSDQAPELSRILPYPSNAAVCDVAWWAARRILDGAEPCPVESLSRLGAGAPLRSKQERTALRAAIQKEVGGGR